MDIIQATDRDENLTERLLEIWETSVRATHHFLSAQDILALRPLVKTALAAIPFLCCAVDATGVPQGFMGVDGDKIAMLFVSPQCRGKGIGRGFVAYAAARLRANRVDVNEQNEQAKGFYNHLGFSVYGRSELDGQGRPFPILHMKLESGILTPQGYAIRPAAMSHIPALNAIERAAAGMFPPGSIPPQMLEDRVPTATLKEAAHARQLWVALDAGQTPVGYALLRIVDGNALLAQVDVLPAHGRRGLGTALVMRAAARARDMGLRGLYLTTFTHVPWNRPFYEKLGFVSLKPADRPGFIKRILSEEEGRGLENRTAMRLALPQTA